MTDRDTITLPREVVQDALEALEGADDLSPGGTHLYTQEREALRTALAAPKQEPTRLYATTTGVLLGSAWLVWNTPKGANDEIMSQETADLLNRMFAEAEALAAPKQEHPGYVIGSHWLETAYSRVCAGEAEADVLRDMGWERVDEVLRRDAERWRKAWAKYIAWQKGGKAEAMENKT